MTRCAFSVILLSVAGLTWAQDADPPLKKAKIGDYVVFKMSGPVTGSMRQEVVAVSEKDVTVKTITTLNGMTLPADTKAYPINTKPDPAAGNKDVKIVDEKSGTETLKIGGKEYRCNWRAVTTLAKVADMEVRSEAKVWISKDAPVFGMVKTASTTLGMTTTVELGEAGGAK
jgi:hypothetical protein